MSLPPNFKLTAPIAEAFWGVNRFPDGQIQFYASCKNADTLECSLFTSEDLDLFYQIIYTINIKKVVVKYLYGARCDKDLADDLHVTNLPEMFMTIVNDSLNPYYHTEYTFWNPHGELKVRKDSIVIPVPEEIKIDTYKAIIYPDQSAYRRMGHVFGDTPAVIASKHRDQITGKITSYELMQLVPGEYLVVDDICDGGATFIKVAEKVASEGVILDLYVTHGLFSRGKEVLEPFYRNIWCTDSCDCRQR